MEKLNIKDVKKSKYKNEFGTLRSDRNIEIHNFLTEQNKKGITELSCNISDFSEIQEQKTLESFLSWYKSKQAVNTFDNCKDSYVIEEYFKDVEVK